VELYADLLRVAAAPPTDEDGDTLVPLVQRASVFLERSPLDATVPWLIWNRPVPPALIAIVASGDDARALAAGAAPPMRWPDEPRDWIETARWSARAAHRALPGVSVTGTPTDIAESLWRGIGSALVEAHGTLGAIVPAARLLRWVALLGVVNNERALFEEASTRVAGLGAMHAEARFHLLVARRMAT
jgi:hypothetical protein